MKYDEKLWLLKDLVLITEVIKSNPDLIVILLLIYIFMYSFKVVNRGYKTMCRIINYNKNKEKTKKEKMKTLYNDYWIEI